MVFEVEEIETCIYRCRMKGELVLVWLHVDDGEVFVSKEELRDM